MAKPLVVIDTSVLFSYGCDSNRWYALLEAVRTGEIVPAVCHSTLEELRDISRRHVPAEKVESFIDSLMPFALLASEPPPVFELQIDPKDSVFFNLAIAVRAFALVSYDRRHVLAVADRRHPQHNELIALAPELRMLHPKDMAMELLRLRSQN